MSTTIRTVESTDETVCRELWAAYSAFYGRSDEITDTITSTTFSRFLEREHPIQCAVAVSGGADHHSIVGFVTWYPHCSTSNIEGNIYIHDLFVKPETRNAGAGRQLIEHVYNTADASGIEVVYWHTQYFNHRAQLLYTNVGRRTDFVRYDRF